MNKLKVAVIGCGHLGRIHARLLSELEDVRLVAVVDTDESAAKEVAREFKTQARLDHQTLGNSIDAAVVAAPTPLHHQIGLDLIRQGIHILMEKPVTMAAVQSEELLRESRQRDTVLAVGHVEQFNPAWTAVRSSIERPLFIQASRTSGFSFRSIDVGVVLDLMIHDLQLILSVVNEPIERVEAVGFPIISRHEDFAEARIQFAGGCVAVVRASRTSLRSEREMHLYQPDSTVIVDFGQRGARIVHRNEQLISGGVGPNTFSPEQIAELKPSVFTRLLPVEEIDVPNGNALQDEQRDFISAIRDRRRPRVNGDDGHQALMLAERILDSIERSRTRGMDEPKAA